MSITSNISFFSLGLPLLPEIFIDIISYNEMIILKYLQLNKSIRKWVLREINSSTIKTKHLIFNFRRNNNFPSYVRAIPTMHILLSAKIMKRASKLISQFTQFDRVNIELIHRYFSCVNGHTSIKTSKIIKGSEFTSNTLSDAYRELTSKAEKEILNIEKNIFVLKYICSKTNA